jgi:hypothetical protein
MSQHIGGAEARYELTGLTKTRGDRMILDLHRQGWKQRDIANALQMTQPAISRAIARLTGKPKPTPKKPIFDEIECDPIPPPESWD